MSPRDRPSFSHEGSDLTSIACVVDTGLKPYRTETMLPPRGTRCCVLLATLAVCNACMPKVSSETPLMAITENVSVSTSQARILLFEHTRNVSALIEAQADQIISETDDPLVERHALEWKAYAIPALHEAGLQPDPIVALIDTWIFGEQMTRYFRDGHGQGRLGSFQSNAIETSARIVETTREFARAMTYTGETPQADSIARAWADEYPLDNHVFARQSVITEWAVLAVGDEIEITDVLGRIDMSVKETTDRLALHNEYLLKQLRWSLELTVTDLLERRVVDSVLTTVLSSLANVEALADSAPHLLHSEVERVLTLLADERSRMSDDVDRQRLETLRHFVTERDIVLAAMTAEREEILAALTAERLAAIANLDSILRGNVLLLSEDLTDRLFGRILQLIVTALVVAAILSLLVMVMLRRKAGAQ